MEKDNQVPVDNKDNSSSEIVKMQTEIINKSAETAERAIEKSLDAKITQMKSDLESSTQEEIKSVKETIEKTSTETAGLQKSIDDLSTSFKEAKDSWGAGRKQIYKHNSLAEIIDKHRDALDALAAGRITHLKLADVDIFDRKKDAFKEYKEKSFAGPGVAPSSTYNQTDGNAANVAREDRITMIMDDDHNYLFRVANYIPSQPSGPVNQIRYNFLKHRPANARFGNTRNTATNVGRTGAHSGTNFDNIGYRPIGQGLNSVSLDFDERYTPVVPIGNILKISKEYLDDTEQLEGFLLRKLMSEHLDWKDNEFVNGPGGSQNVAAGQLASSSSDVSSPALRGINNLAFKYTGDQSGTDESNILAAWKDEAGSLANLWNACSSHTNYFDCINLAACILNVRGYRPNLLILSIPDSYIFNVSKAQITAEYLRGFGVRQNNPSPISILEGIQVVPSNVQADGTFTLLDTNCVSYRVREPLSLEASMEQDDFSRNRITFRMLERGALLGYEESGIISETFSRFKNVLNASTGSGTGFAGNPDAVVNTDEAP